MIDNISFKNYKIFKNEQDLEIKPITVIFGKNNTGKSAVLKLPIFIESSLVCKTKEVFELECQDVELGAEMRDIIYGKANRAMEFSLSNIFSSKIFFSAFSLKWSCAKINSASVPIRSD